MASSPLPRPVEIDELDRWRTRLRRDVAADPELVLAPNDQLSIENSIATVVCLLAGEEPEAPSTTPPERAMLARDLLITTDLVFRAWGRT